MSVLNLHSSMANIIVQSHGTSQLLVENEHHRERSRSASTSPRRVSTFPPVGPSEYVTSRTNPRKRIIVCCDGTWQDGIVVDARWKYTNVLRLSRAVRHADDRVDPPIPQVVFYQSGIGSSNNLYSQIVDGATGASLGEKVEEAYAFIAQNYHPGDEIFLFGFSRGAYTARTVASFIGEIGILNRIDMDHFADIFVAFQKRGKAEDEDEKKALDAMLDPWVRDDAPGKKRADSGPDGFSIKCVGVFDTVGSVGLPEELTRHSETMKTLFGFRDKSLGEHIEKAYQALALNERRADFDCAKFEQTEGGRRKKQVLKQCWFTGCHSDIGGGYQEHDLADLTLTWMAANVGDILALNVEYIASLPNPVAPWGELPPHNSVVGIFALAKTIQRKIPTETDNVTHESIHPSVLRQKTLVPELAEHLAKNPHLVCDLLPLEEELKAGWPNALKQSKKGEPVVNSLAVVAQEGGGSVPVPRLANGSGAVVQASEKQAQQKTQLGYAMVETSMSAIIREFRG